MIPKYTAAVIILLGLWINVSCIIPATLQATPAFTPTTIVEPTKDVSATFKKMEVDRYRFEVPENQKIVEAKNARMNEFIKGQLVYGGRSGNIWFFIVERELSPDEKFEEVYRKAYLDFKNLMPSYQPLSEDKFSQGNSSAYKHIYKYPWGEPWYKQYDLWIMQGNSVAVASCYHYPNIKEEQAAEQACEHFLDTFQFNN